MAPVSVVLPFGDEVASNGDLAYKVNVEIAVIFFRSLLRFCVD